MAKRKQSVETTALLYIAIGILFIIFRGGVLNWMMTAIGALFIVFGILDLTKNRTFNGVVNIAIGIAVIICGWTLLSIVLLIFGIMLALKGLLALLASFKRPKVLPILAAILTIAVGVVLIFFQQHLVDWFFIAMGAVLVVNGIMALIK